MKEEMHIGAHGYYTQNAIQNMLINIDKKDKIFSNCPICGASRVNIYYKDGVWQCKKCWDKEITSE